MSGSSGAQRWAEREMGNTHKKRPPLHKITCKKYAQVYCLQNLQELIPPVSLIKAIFLDISQKFCGGM